MRSPGCTEANSNAKTKSHPPLKWAGGKTWLLPHLESVWREYKNLRLVEPFCGGLAVALGLQPEQALLNDANLHLINFYKRVRSGLQITIETRNDEATFYRHRDRFNGLVKAGEDRSAEAAQLFYYLNRTCFNGLCRFNRRGEFNVPFGSHKTINYARDFDNYREAFSRWTFTNGDFEKIEIASTDFIYADPPYDVEFTTYSAGGFSWLDQMRVAEWLAIQSVPVVLSNQATMRIVELYSSLGFSLQYFDAPRRISCTGDRASAREILATKNMLVTNVQKQM
ncbi:MAG: Dam family site-specific DNA-(adenine-N6)-methyltransferase [Pyrinomonadaceae bacterium]|nr:Dam family site-specific DNA-(adenine-N6)-methyltransferase [Pyrinomonadaceae bacterium]